VTWWRLRSWKKDLDVLARVLDGLKALREEGPEDTYQNEQEPVAGQEPDVAIAAIRDTFAIVAGASDEATAYFYAALFVQTYNAVSALMIRAAEEDGGAAPAYWPAEVVQHEERRRGIDILTVAPTPVLPCEAGATVGASAVILSPVLKAEAEELAVFRKMDVLLSYEVQFLAFCHPGQRAKKIYRCHENTAGTQ
jgi:hypothetical protein